MLGLALALSSSVFWGVSDFIGGLQARRLPLVRLMLATQAIGLVGLGVVLAVRGAGPPPFVKLLPAMGGGLAGAAALSAFYRGLAIGSMSIVAPISSTGVGVPVIAGIIRGERPAAVQIIGICAAVTGIVLASREAPHDRRPHREDGARSDLAARFPREGESSAHVSRRSIVMAVLAALGFGLFFLGVQESARYDALWSTFAARSASVAGLSLVAVRLGTPLLRGGAWRPLVAIGFLDVGANTLYAIATRHGLLSLVSVAASVYPLATVILARVLLRERVRRVQEIGVLAALTGVLLIAAG